MTPDPFPNELVEAAACAITTSGRRGSTDQEAQAYDAAYAVLAAVVPLIEQRVIDRLAREAGENPYRDLSMPLLSEACKIEAEVWDAGAACGVAAERARGAAAMIREFHERVVPRPSPHRAARDRQARARGKRRGRQ